MSTAPFRQPVAEADRIDPITAAVIQGALENIAIEMGHKLMRMCYSSIIRESEDFGAALTDAEGRGLAECDAVDAAAVGPDPGLHPRHPEDARRRAATRSGPATSSCTTTPMAAPATDRTSPSSCRCSSATR